MVPPTTTPTLMDTNPDIYLDRCQGIGFAAAFLSGFTLAGPGDFGVAFMMGAIAMIVLGIPFGLAAIALGAFGRFICRSAGAAAARRRGPTRRGRAAP